jgi:hypothetical protein
MVADSLEVPQYHVYDETILTQATATSNGPEKVIQIAVCKCF